MAYTARLGTSSLNTTSLGLFLSELFIFINGVDVTRAGIDLDSLQLTRRQDGPDLLTFDTLGLPVTEGQQVIIRDGGSGTNFLSGRIYARMRVITVEQVYGASSTQRVTYRCVCNDRWLLDRFDVVTKIYGGQGVNGIVADILATFTDGGYAVGEISSSLGELSVTFTYTRVVEALERIAAAVGGHLMIDPRDLRVSIVTSVDDGHQIVLDDTDTSYWGFRYRTDISQLRTRTIVEGSGSRLAAAVSLSSTTITLDDITEFAAAGGKARLRDQEFDYTGINAEASQLTGVTNLATDGKTGDAVTLVVQEDDSAAQTALATILGGGNSGIVTHYIRESALSQSEAAAKALADLGLFSEVIPNASYLTRSRFTTPGKVIVINRTTPVAITSITATIESVLCRTVGVPVSGDTRFVYDVSATPDELTLTDILGKV